MDVTTVLAWNRPPVGIVRTELECARQAIAYGGQSGVSLCYYSKNTGEFRRLSAEQEEKLRQLLNDVYDRPPPNYGSVISSVRTIEEQDATGLVRLLRGKSRLVYTIDPVLNECVRGWIFDRRRPQKRISIELYSDGVKLCSKLADQFRPDLLNAGMSDGYCSFEIPISEIIKSFNQEKCLNIQIFAQAEKLQLVGELTINPDALTHCRARVSALREGELISLGRDDVYVTAGLDWEYKDFSKIYRMKKERGFRVVGFCYDLIPVKFPHLCVGDVASLFAKYFVDLSWCADHIVCISECTRMDYLQFATSAGCPVVDTSVVRLGSELKRRQSDFPVGREVANIAQSKYLLFVSTIERRKNHEVLYRAYTRLVEKGVESLPTLVFVGMRGWGVGELLFDISLDPRVKDLIKIMDHVSDEELNLLYERSLFTVFPSLYEGWGLPVAEAVTHGKFCLASNRGSIPEIAGRLVDYLDPWNVQEWADRIEFLIKDPKLLAEKEKLIHSNFIADRWAVCIDQIFRTAELVRQSD